MIEETKQKVLCLCGCGQEVREGKSFVNGGHAARFRRANGLIKQQEKLKSLLYSQGQDATTESLSQNLSDSAASPISESHLDQMNALVSSPTKQSWLSRILHRKPKEKQCSKKFPGKVLSEKEIRALKSDQVTEKLTDEQKFLRFFGNLPKWTHKKPGKLAYKLAKWRSGDFTIKHCVFVDEDGENKQAYIPYNQELGFLFTDTAFYDVPLKDTETIFLDSRRFAPLVNRKNYKDEFEIPEDLANALINIGIGYGQLSQFKALIQEIKKTFMLNFFAYILTVLALVGIMYVMYADGKHYQTVADQVGNMTAIIKQRFP